MESEEKNKVPAVARKMHNFMQILDSSCLRGIEIRDDFNRGDIRSLPPSEYIKQLSMTTEERIELLMRNVRTANTPKTPNNCKECQDFQVVPHIIVFQSYALGNVYNVAVTIRNTSKVSHYLKLSSEKDPSFAVRYKGVTASPNIRLAPGMYATYNVRFSPEENRDYKHEIKFTTDHQSFTIPVIAIGPRAILDFPDEISISETPVKILSSKSLLVRNVGDTAAIFNIYTSSAHFWVEPTKGVIDEEETIQFVVNFLSEKTGFFQENLYLSYESGETVRMQVQSSAIDCNVRLERSSIRMQDGTYLGLSTSKTLKIINRSDYIVNYRWMRYKDAQTDRDRKQKYKKIFDSITKLEIPRCVDLEHYNICMPKTHEVVYQRIYTDEIASLVEENFLYNCHAFSIDPMDGEIWPQSEVDVTVIFEPDETGEISSVAYLEVTGREERIPLSLSGISIGPVLKLNVTTIDVQNILLRCVHNYEVICANKGLIPGILVYRHKPSDFGGIIEVTPKHLKLRPDEYKSFNVSFLSNRNGDFVESVEFVVKESLEVVSMYIKGRVVCPTLHFDDSELDFGTTALGFTVRREVMLRNDSLVPVTFSIIVPDDGHETAITHEDFVKSQMKPIFSASPREFTILPNEGIVEAQSSLKIQVNLTANLARVGKTTLRVDMWDGDSVPVSLPISFRSLVATLFVTPPEIAIRFCFIDFPYSRNLIVENRSEVEGYFYLLPQSFSDSTTMLYSMSTNHGYLAPGQSTDVTLTITTKAMGNQKSILSMLTFGEKAPTACCTVTCNGQGPVVSVQPTSLDFTNVELLQERTMNLSLISDSPIPAEFKASLSSKNSAWTVSPCCGCLNPGETIDLRVTVFLRDAGKHSDKIIMTVTNGRNVIVSLNAIGVGSCIVCNPPIFPTFEIGSLFRQQNASLPIELTNHGSRNLKLVFSNAPEIRMYGGRLQPPICDKFSIEPFVFEIPARSTQKVFCKTIGSDSCGTVSEEWWLHCWVDGQGKREVINTSMFIATFVESSISFSKNELSFGVQPTTNHNKSLSVEELLVTNKSGFDSNAHLSINNPFGIIDEKEDLVENLNIVFPKYAERRIRVFFSPTNEHKEKRNSLVISGVLKIEYEDHPRVDKVKCLAVLTFPNIAPLPKEIRFNCPLGCSCDENILLRNDGPLEVSYKFIWIDKFTFAKRERSNLKITNSKDDACANGNEECDNSDLLLGMEKTLRSVLTDSLFAEETEISVLQSLSTSPPTINRINRIFSIVPCEGIVPANSSQFVSLGFHPIETVNLEAELVCELTGGPTESIQIFAAADTIKFYWDKNQIDFGEQIICERSRATMNLQNTSKIDFVCHVELTEEPNKSLEIRPVSVLIPAESTRELEIISLPVALGAYDKSFLLCAQHQNPVSITVTGNVAIPQIYVSLPRKNLFKDYSVELGYRSIQAMANSFDHFYEIVDGWEIVPDNNTLPSVMDIEMAIESLIARDFLLETRPFTSIGYMEGKENNAIPFLFSPEYVLDMGYVIVGERSNATIHVFNYGSRNARVRLKMLTKVNNLSKYGINIFMRDQMALLPGEFADIQVSLNPSKLNVSEKSSEIKTTFYLEVTNGFTLPITIVAAVTVPSVMVHSQILNFHDVLIGECVLQHLQIKNDGLIDCAWQAKLTRTQNRQSDGPFYLHNGSDIYTTGQSGRIKIYFRPQKSGHFENQLMIQILRGYEPLTVLLRGRGIEQKIKIVPPSINFDPALPYSKPEAKTFTIENIGHRPLELYWHHIDKLTLREDRLIRVLTHYYNVEEILLPIRTPLAPLPTQLFEFYNALVYEMKIAAKAKNSSSNLTDADSEMVAEINLEHDKNVDTVETTMFPHGPRTLREAKARKISKRLPRTRSTRTISPELNLSTAISNEFETSDEHDQPDDPDEIEHLLHCYIDELQKLPIFHERMKDPVKEVFDALEKKGLKPELEKSTLLHNKKKICMIFHGSPFTEYQQSACKTSRALDVPLVNLNNALTEMIALGNTACSAKLREIIDAKYLQMLSVNDKSESKTNFLAINDLNVLDSLSRYEYKIEMIGSNLEKIGNISTLRDTARKAKNSARNSEKGSRSARVKVEETFLNIDLQLLVELLGERLAMEDLTDGFVLQSLTNHFITSEKSSLLSLLQVLGDVEYPIFVTFNTSVVPHKSKSSIASNEKEVSADAIAKKLIDIDEMPFNEFDVLLDVDKKLYREQVVWLRGTDALNKQEQFQRRLAEIRKERKLKRRESLAKTVSKSVKNLTKNKSRIISDTVQLNEKTLTQQLSDKNKLEKAGSVQNDGSKKINEDAEIYADGMDAYSFNLHSILPVLHNWDPARHTLDTEQPEMSRRLKHKNAIQVATENPTGRTGRFWIWHVKINDPRNLRIIDGVFYEITRNKEILTSTTQDVPVEDEDGLRCQTYFVAQPKSPTPQIRELSPERDFFHLVALKSRTTDQSSNDSLKIDRSDSFDHVEAPLESRIVLQPQEARTFKVYFSPKISHAFEAEYALGDVNYNKIIYNTKITGSGDIPRIDMDPSRIFKRVKRVKKNDLNDPTFFEDTQIFDFGSLLLTDKSNRAHRKTASFKLCNISKMDAELGVSLEAFDSEVFNIKPTKLFIKPDESGVIDVTASVTNLGVNEGRVFLAIKNNPRVEVIRVCSIGTKLDVALEETDISFGRVILNKRMSKHLIIHNNSSIPIFWKITPAASIDAQIQFAPSMGWTKARTTDTVLFTFLANRIGIMDTLIVNYNVFLNCTDKLEDTLFTKKITITGETYDVEVDVNFANPIDLGIVKVGTIINRPFELRNRGQYDVNFAIEFENSDTLPVTLDRNIRKNLMEDLEIVPSVGNLAPGKITIVNVTFHAKFEMHLRQVPLLRCILIDGNSTATAVATIPLTLSIRSYSPSFRLTPDTKVSFGPVSTCHNKTLQFNVENTGFFPIKYQIRNASLSAPSLENSSRRTKREKSPKSELKKKGTAKSQELSSSLQLGPFTVFDINGNIDAGEIKTLAIDCYPQIEGHFEETCFIGIDDSFLDNKSGKCLLLEVDSILPSIDFCDLDPIFPESYLVDSIKDFHCPKEIDDHTIFSRDEKCLYFRRIKIHKPHSTSMKLHNRGLVPARVTIHLCPDVLSPKNAKPDTFAIDTIRECIQPMSSQIFCISFTPNLIETYTGMLEASVELPVHLNHDLNKLTINLSGECCVPEVTIIEPSADPRTGKRYMRFGRCVVNEISSRNLSFKNVGNIRAEVIVGLDHDTEMVYSVQKSEIFCTSSGYGKDSGTASTPENCSIICTLASNESAQLAVKFRPKEVGYTKAQIQFHVLDNPYEHLTVEIDGEGFVENVVLENLSHVEIARSGMSNGENRTRKSLKNRGNSYHSGSGITLSPQSIVSANVIYNLDYGTCPVNKMRRINFKIANKTANEDFRFEFPSHPELVFEPSVGHLQRSEKKEMTAIFLASEPITYDKTTLECAVSKIRFPVERKEIRSWDDRERTVEWVEVNNGEEDDTQVAEKPPRQKTVVPTREPSHETIPGTSRIIQLMFSVLAAYTEFTCITTKIHFRDTLMFQNREYAFSMENPGNVDLCFNWKIDMEAGYPTRLPKNLIRPPSFRARREQSADTRPSSRASSGILYPEAEKSMLSKCAQPYVQEGDELRVANANDRDTDRPIESPGTSYVVDVEPVNSSNGYPFDMFSDSFARTRSSGSWMENDDDQPFNIKPDIGVIPARESIQFTVRFSPLDVFEYKANLVCQIESLNPNLEQPNIIVTAKSLLPYCHFDIEESDYLTSGRRDPNLLGLPQMGGSGDSNEIIHDSFSHPRVVEFHVIGSGECHVKEFHLINPTTENYRFTWRDVTSRKPEELPYFHCTEEEGLAESGKRTNVVFSFYAAAIGTFESFWHFSIDRYNLETLFLLIATVVEPSIRFAETRLKLKPTVVGIKVEDTLTIVNDEAQRFSWKILPNTLHAEQAALQALSIFPTSGILEPTSKQILQVSLLPSCVGEFTFPLQCQVKGMNRPLGILVSARVSQIRPRILYSNDNEGEKMLEIYYDRDNVLDFGKLNPNEPATIKFEISNTSDVMFYYTWDLGTNDSKYLRQRNGAYILTISKDSDHASNASPSTCYLQLTVLRETNVRQHPVTLKIDGGPTYRMFVKASRRSHAIGFSFVHYDFGPCYIRGPISSPYDAQLLITNNNKIATIMECRFENLPHMTINHDALSQAIPGNATVTIPIYFHPREPSKYQENVVFYISESKIEQTVVIKGEGISYKIRLEKVCDKFIELGNVPVGKVITRKIRVANCARAPIEVLFNLISKLPAYDEDHAGQSVTLDESILRPRRTKELPLRTDGSRETAIAGAEDKDSILNMFSVKPEHKITLLIGKTTEIIVKFAPTKRVSSFVEKIGAQADTTILPLFFVRGRCVAREFSLDRNHLYFGTVVKDCAKTTKLALRNSGDFGTRFKWNTSKLSPHFELRPVSGYCSPGMDITFDVTFHPQQLSSVLEAEASVDIEKYPSLKVKCSGACCKIRDAIDVIKFATPVRSEQMKQLAISNESNDTWNVETAVNGEYFRAEEAFIIPAKQSYSCTVVYCPLRMNTEKNPHEGKLIIKLPEGEQPLVYDLFGLSMPPEIRGKNVRQLPAKTKYAELLPVHNWLNRAQSFHCDIKLINAPKVNPVVYSFTGHHRLDVPANGTRDYRATFHCYVETTLHFRITFTNDDGEYEFYEIQYKVTKPDALSTIKLTTPARTKKYHELAIENPLDDETITFSANCQHPDITIRNVPKDVTSKSGDKITIEYSPLVAGESTTKLNVTCAQLGNFPYELKLKATAASAEKVIRLMATLGSSTNFPIVINNVTKKTADFTITIEDPSFTCNRKISIPPQKNGILEVSYEPCDAKNVNTILRATSETLGEFCFPLIGSYDLPKPQGPFTILQNTTIDISFKNVFATTKTFAHVIDGTNKFSVVKFPGAMKSKEVATICVGFSDRNNSLEEEREYPITGKLLVSCTDSLLPQLCWIYYLRGVK